MFLPLFESLTIIQNAALVEQSAAATESMKSQAAHMQSTVGVFRLPSSEESATAVLDA